MSRSQFDLVGAGWRVPLGVDGRGGIALSKGVDEIEEAIQIILMTPIGQRVMRPRFGSRIHELVFAPMNIETSTAAAHYVREALGYWEPRIVVIDVMAEPDPHTDGCLLIYIVYEIKTTHDRRALVFPFYTIPGES
ncbi:MAG TPA: GPW/gp25 family protein [Roseiflexaceae bacterium]|nr:GPW/gp25 family protein [Roseiflexaceae bacterium]HMP41238.1 GPW/gp25 family protein [Roseiflexaceae bacterium]